MNCKGADGFAETSYLGPADGRIQERGAPHVHFVAFILFNILGILVLHYVFRWLIDFLSKHTRGSREAWAGAFRFLPVLLGMQLGIKLTKDILDLPKFVRHILNQHFHSLVIFTVTLFTAHLIAAYLKSRLSKSEERSSSMSILATVVDIGVYMVGFLFILNSYGISISPLLTALGAGGLGFRPGPAGYLGQPVFRHHHHLFQTGADGGTTSNCPAGNPAGWWT